MGPAKELVDYDSPDWTSHAKSAIESPSSPISRLDDSVTITEKRSDARKKTSAPMDESRSTSGRDRKAVVGGKVDSAATMGDDAAESRPKYRSWKKKWRKLRVIFDMKLHEAEVLWDQEEAAKATVKRIAIENDRLLDLLTDLNSCPQIPADKRIHIPPSSPTDSPALPGFEPPSKTLESLESQIPDLHNLVTAPLDPSPSAPPSPSPTGSESAHFLSIDDVESYLHDIDTRMGLARQPSLASNAKDLTNGTNGTNGLAPAQQQAQQQLPNWKKFMFKHPHSTYNWLKANAPQVFLNDHHDDEDKKSSSSKNKPSAASKAGGRASTPGGASSRASKRQSTAAKYERAARASEDVDLSGDEEAEYATPVPKKRKRVVDDDGGYRPKGGSSRPSKKKRKSEGGEASAEKSTKKKKAGGDVAVKEELGKESGGAGEKEKAGRKGSRSEAREREDDEMVDAGSPD